MICVCTSALTLVDAAVATSPPGLLARCRHLGSQLLLRDSSTLSVVHCQCGACRCGRDQFRCPDRRVMLSFLGCSALAAICDAFLCRDGRSRLIENRPEALQTPLPFGVPIGGCQPHSSGTSSRIRKLHAYGSCSNDAAAMHRHTIQGSPMLDHCHVKHIRNLNPLCGRLAGLLGARVDACDADRPYLRTRLQTNTSTSSMQGRLANSAGGWRGCWACGQTPATPTS